MNLTAQYLNDRIKATGGLDGTFWTLLRDTLSAKLKVSAVTDRVEDHIQSAMCGLIHRDALRDRIQEGLPISDARLATFILRCAYNDLRGESRNPVVRELYGAITPKERKNGYKKSPIRDPRIVWDVDHQIGWVDIQDLGGPMSAPQVQGSIYYNECWQKIEAVLKVKKPKAWKRYLTVLQMRAEGALLKEIAEAEGIAYHCVEKIIKESQGILQNKATRQQLALN